MPTPAQFPAISGRGDFVGNAASRTPQPAGMSGRGQRKVLLEPVWAAEGVLTGLEKSLQSHSWDAQSVKAAPMACAIIASPTVSTASLAMVRTTAVMRVSRRMGRDIPCISSL
jgi:hypothetical protein